MWDTVYLSLKSAASDMSTDEVWLNEWRPGTEARDLKVVPTCGWQG